MTLVYSNPNPAIARLVWNALDAEGIPAVVRGASNGAAGGELPPVAAWAEVWVADDGRLADSRALVAEATAEPDPTAALWTCPACGETSEAHFGACWNCGAERPAEA